MGGQTILFNLGMATSLGKGKLNSHSLKILLVSHPAYAERVGIYVYIVRYKDFNLGRQLPTSL